MNFPVMKAAVELKLGVRALLALELFRVAAGAGRPLRIGDLHQEMGVTADHALAVLMRVELVDSFVVPENRKARVYALSEHGKALLGIEVETKLPKDARYGNWTGAEKELLGTDTDEVIAGMLRRTTASVRVMRAQLKIPQYGGKRKGRWKTEEGGFVYR